MVSVKLPIWAAASGRLLLRFRLRRELRRLKVDHERLRQAVFQVEQMKSAIERWKRNR